VTEGSGVTTTGKKKTPVASKKRESLPLSAIKGRILAGGGRGGRGKTAAAADVDDADDNDGIGGDLHHLHDGGDGKLDGGDDGDDEDVDFDPVESSSLLREEGERGVRGQNRYMTRSRLRRDILKDFYEDQQPSTGFTSTPPKATPATPSTGTPASGEFPLFTFDFCFRTLTDSNLSAPITSCPVFCLVFIFVNRSERAREKDFVTKEVPPLICGNSNSHQGPIHQEATPATTTTTPTEPSGCWHPDFVLPRK